MSRAGGRPIRLGPVVGLVAVLALAAGARLAASADAFRTGAFVPTDSDTLYHLRRMQLTVEAWPRPAAFDPEICWPRGGPIPWAPGVDLVGAAALTLGAASPLGGWLSVALLHLALGLLLVALTVELVRFLLPPSPARLGAALAAGVVVALMPQAVESTQLGIIDHHVVEALTLLGLARWALAAPPAGLRSARWRAGYEAVGAALSGGAVLCFTGSPLYVALVLPLLAWPILGAVRPDLLGSGAPALLGGALLAAAGTAPTVAVLGRALTYAFPSWLQPALLAAAGAALALLVLVGRLAPAQPRWRRPALLAPSLLALSLGLLALPGLGGELGVVRRDWLLRGDPWLARIDEFQPMWRGLRAATVREVSLFLGAPGLLLPLALPWAVAVLVPTGWRRALGVAWLLVATLGLSLLQVRFGRVAAPWIGAGLGLALAGLAARLVPGPGPGAAVRRRLAGALPLLAVAALLLLDPGQLAVFRRPGDPWPDAAIELGLDLRNWPADPAAPGVLAPWDLGNHALVLGGRPVVADGFGSFPDPRAFEDAERAFRVAEPELLSIARARRVGVVVAGAANLFGRVRGPGSGLPFAGTGFNPDWLRAVPSAPLLLGGSGVPSLGLQHAEHLLPRFAATRTVAGLDRPLPVLWGYEIVPGARLAGVATPGQRVVLELPLTEHQRPHLWRAATLAGPDGRWSITVPVPTDLTTPTVRTAPGWLRLGDGPARPQAVPEAAVRAGQVIAAAAAPR